MNSVARSVPKKQKQRQCCDFYNKFNWLKPVAVTCLKPNKLYVPLKLMVAQLSFLPNIIGDKTACIN